MKLSPHFSYEEMTRSQTAERFGINNQPGEEHLINLVYVCQLMERVRRVCGDNVVHVSSGYRCPELNKRIGGSSRSAHMRGLAVDFTIPGYGSVREVCDEIRLSNIPFKKLIEEFGRWVHIEAHPMNEGGQGLALTATKINGTTTYEVAA